jgi:hypothetical protein
VFAGPLSVAPGRFHERVQESAVSSPSRGSNGLNDRCSRRISECRRHAGMRTPQELPGSRTCKALIWNSVMKASSAVPARSC